MSEETIQIRIETPQKLPISRDAASVFLTTIDGITEIWPDHARIVFALGVGVCRILDADGKEEKLAIYNGLAHFKNNELLILAKNMELPAEIDVNRCEEALRRIKRRTDDRDQELPLSKIDWRRLRASEQRARLRLSIK